ncbi:DNRLRE domain-containing protein, partial [Planctomycetota bacterium]
VTKWVEYSCGVPADPDKPTANFTFTPGTPTIGENVSFTDTSTTPSGSIDTWVWDFGDTGSAGIADPTHSYAAANTYSVTLTVTTTLGKSDSITKTVTVVSGVEVTDTFQQGTASYAGCSDVYIRFDDYGRKGADDEIRIYEGGVTTESRMLLEFDLSSIAAGSTVSSAKLEIYGWNMYGDGVMNMHAVTADWSEDAATGANWYDAVGAATWGTPGGDYSVAIISSLVTVNADGNDAWYEWTIPAATIQGWLDSPATNNGVIIVGTGGPPTGDLQDRFRSSEWGTVGQRPKLSVTYFDAAAVPNNPPNAPTTPSPADSATEVLTSPSLSVVVTDPDSDSMNVSFYDASGPALIGTHSGVASGGTATVSWNGLSGSTVYTWYAVADDGSDTTPSATWSFTTILDSDDDGMPDVWEIYFGLNENLAADAASDTDGDGAPALLEFLAGGDVADPESSLYHPDTDDFPATTDSDLDGMWDINEFGYFGNLNQPGNADYDIDGYNNNQEVNQGFDPTDDTSFPPPPESSGTKGGCGAGTASAVLALLGLAFTLRRKRN